MKRIVLAAVAAVVAALGAGACTGRAAVYFDFHKISNTGSVLYETWQDAATGKVYAQQSWRAGSGYSIDECLQGAGWLPSGYYNIVSHYDHYDGTKVKGRVWQLSDKACWNGTPRSELFIHSEETADNGQYCTAIYDDPFCWEGDFDYKSAGCIKVAHAAPYPSDIARADSAWHNWGGGSGYLNLYHRVFVY
jgi:hypothetical protein